MDAAFERAVLAQLLAIPPGRVSSYGVLAALAGYPRHARHVGKLLASAPEDAGWPWFRVVSGSGRIARPGTPQADYQRLLLEEDGVEVGRNGRIDLRRYGWPDRPACGLAPCADHETSSCYDDDRAGITQHLS